MVRRDQNRQPKLTTRPKKDRGSDTAFVNVGDLERMVSAVGGGALALYGLSRGTLGGLCLAGIGGCLAYRGLCLFDAGLCLGETQPCIAVIDLCQHRTG